jgi:hypothetical protein
MDAINGSNLSYMSPVGSYINTLSYPPLKKLKLDSGIKKYLNNLDENIKRLNLSNKKLENKISYLNEALILGFDVEVDVWSLKGSLYLGHDQPQHKVNKEFLQNKKVWCHAKNLDALTALKKIKSHFIFVSDINIHLF